MKGSNATVDVDIDEALAVKQKTSIFSDPQSIELFDDPGFEINEESHKFSLFIPSAVAQKGQVPEVEDMSNSNSSTGT